MKTFPAASVSIVRQLLMNLDRGLYGVAVAAACFCLSADVVSAAERVVTLDDGWKIAIAPRDVVMAARSLEKTVVQKKGNVARKPAANKNAKQKKKNNKNVKRQQKKNLNKSAKPRGDLPIIVPRAVHKPTYYEVYDSIPFLRTEYLANPSYRSEATMEILFGKLRPTTIYKNAPQIQSGRPQYRLTYPYARRRRVNYNFYYPRPTVYRRY